MPKQLKRIQVYRNLKHGYGARPLYSVRYKGRVIKHVHRILLVDCKFIVNEAGRQRVLKTGSKNVHAWVDGIDAGRAGAFGIDECGRDFLRRIEYNPYVANTFYNPWQARTFLAGDGYSAVYGARAVLLNERGMSACYLDFSGKEPQ